MADHDGEREERENGPPGDPADPLRSDEAVLQMDKAQQLGQGHLEEKRRANLEEEEDEQDSNHLWQVPAELGEDERLVVADDIADKTGAAVPKRRDKQAEDNYCPHNEAPPRANPSLELRRRFHDVYSRSVRIGQYLSVRDK